MICLHYLVVRVGCRFLGLKGDVIVILYLFNRSGLMKKPTFITKLFTMAQHADLGLINHDSPLLLFRSKPLRHPNLQEPFASPQHQQQASQINSKVYLPFSDTFKEETVKPQTGIVNIAGEVVQKEELIRAQKKRTRTMPNDRSVAVGLKQGQHNEGMRPALMIREIKLKKTFNKQKYQPNTYTSNPNVNVNDPESPFKLGATECSPTLSTKYYSTLKTNLKRETGRELVLSVEEEKNITKRVHRTEHNFGSKNNRNRSVFVKQIHPSNDSFRQQHLQRKVLSFSASRPRIPPKNITAKSYIVYKTHTLHHPGKILISESCKSRVQIASLTKIMTAILVIELCRRFSIDKYAEEVVVTDFESSIGGTSANIQPGEIYTIQQLLYGLMLPSGNDASLALATWAGQKLIKSEQEQQQESHSPFKNRNKTEAAYQDQNLSARSLKERHYRRFIAEMNAKAKQLRLKRTNYANSHGLSNPQNKSCPFDLALLCEYCLQNETFRNVVSTGHYKGAIRANSNKSHNKMIGDNRLEGSKSRGMMVAEWHNTHELVRKHPDTYIGIKTGFTYTAGPCLASCFVHENREYVVVLLGCETSSMRFRDTQNLRKWCIEQEQAARGKANLRLAKERRVRVGRSRPEV